MEVAMQRKYIWIGGLLAIVLVIALPIAFLATRPQATVAAAPRDPWDGVPVHQTHTDHSDIISSTFDSPQAVTLACLECHPDAAGEVMHTTHWTWESQPMTVTWRDEPVTIGKKNQINNFCIGIQGNWKKCTSCHAGYGWSDADFDFGEPANVDCLACHADTASYAKGDFGLPAEGIDLLAAAQSVRMPTRDNCGKCHFDGGGGNGVKHGDLDESLRFPSADLDVHMGEFDFLCTDCHKTEDHQIKGKLLADNVTIDAAEQVACTDCHDAALHEDERINLHTDSVACQTCHIPATALKDPTKVEWDWSTAGQDLPEDHLTYLKIKGSFVYENNYQPTYQWFNGDVEYRYLLGDTFDPSQPLLMNPPAGAMQDPEAKIFPFKIHVAKQPYDVQYKTLLQPVTAGEGGFWSEFDWNKSFELATQYTGLPYSGEYGFTETWMHWPATHMVQAKEKALQCEDCHGSEGRMDWAALGYEGDPVEWGGRFDKQAQGED
jgi:octaheme c-type cytochrome (tetrathionate reductase family)